MSMFFLNVIDFVPGQPTPLGFMANDAPNHTVVLSTANLMDAEIQANGAVLAIFYAVDYIRAASINTQLQAELASALKGAISGIAELIISRPDIESTAEAQSLSDSELARLSQTQVSHQFNTRIEGYLPGQQYLYINEDEQLSVLLDIQSVSEQYETLDDQDENVLYSIKATTLPVDFQKLFVKFARLSQRPPKRRFTRNS